MHIGANENHQLPCSCLKITAAKVVVKSHGKTKEREMKAAEITVFACGGCASAPPRGFHSLARSLSVLLSKSVVRISGGGTPDREESKLTGAFFAYLLSCSRSDFCFRFFLCFFCSLCCWCFTPALFSQCISDSGSLWEAEGSQLVTTARKESNGPSSKLSPKP